MGLKCKVCMLESAKQLQMQGGLLCGLIIAFSSLLKYFRNNISFLSMLGDAEFCPYPEFLDC